MLCIIPEYPPAFGGGIGTYYGGLLPALAAAGVEVMAVVGSALVDGSAQSETLGVHVRPLEQSLAAKRREEFSHLGAAPDFVRHLAAGWAAWEQTDGGRGFDWVETTDWGLLFVPWVLNPKGQPRCNVTLHGSIGQISLHSPEHGHELSHAFARIAEPVLLSAADRLATYGRGNAQEWTAATGREVAYCPPPLAPVAVPKQAERCREIVVAGRIQAWKGPATLAAALQPMGNSTPAVNWFGRDTPAPDGSLSTSTWVGSRFPGVWGKKILPMPPIAPDQLRARFASARAVVVPSTWDVFNYTCAEAMQIGAVVVCSKGAGAADLIEDGVNGFTFPAGDSAALAVALGRAMGLSEAERQTIGKAASATVADALAPAAIAGRYLAGLDTATRPPNSATAIAARLAPEFTPGKRECDPQAWQERLPLRQIIDHATKRVFHKVTGR